MTETYVYCPSDRALRQVGCTGGAQTRPLCGEGRDGPGDQGIFFFYCKKKKKS